MSNFPIEVERIEKDYLKKFLRFIKSSAEAYILRNELLIRFSSFMEAQDANLESYDDLYVYRFLKSVQELIMIDKDTFIFVYRYRIAKYIYFKVLLGKKVTIKPVKIEEYLDARDHIINDMDVTNRHFLLVDFLPFYDYSPSIKDSKEIGKGIYFLNRYLSSNIFQHPDKWYQILYHFLSIHSMEGQQLLINSKVITNFDQLVQRLDFMMHTIDDYFRRDKPELIFKEMKDLGFEPGWGNTLERIQETMQLLVECLHAPDADILEKFVARIPMISKIALMSPHGWFSQGKVLGRPDTGGQVVYILDKVKYLEKELTESLQLAGIKIKPKIIIITRLIPEADGTSCDQEYEKVNNTDNCWIIRVPFKKKDGTVHPSWISRFHVWPYLEQFAADVKHKLLEDFKGKPDLVVGNYSDGNLVATFLSQDLGIMQCNIAHALEKTKYLFSDLYWESMEEKYNFSFQYTADLIAMNMASFIITSTFQEIGGTGESLGQYESYLSYSLPNLYHVKTGVNLFHPKFNVVPPGIPEDVFFCYSNIQKRDPKVGNKMAKLVFHQKRDDIFGQLENPDKFPIFSMARIDKVKNLSGLIEVFGANKKLREIANLIIIADKISVKQSKDEEEKHEIDKMYSLIEKYKLKKHIRWVGIGASASRKELGEVYRLMADKRGIFVQPALFEAFGLTVLESMGSGLPTFATKFGGPSEIIQNGENGFLINPTISEQFFETIYNFLIQSYKDPKVWETISNNGLERIKKSYNWNLYSDRLLTLAKLYGFWKFSVSMKAKEKMKLYCDILFDDFYRKRLPEDY